MTLVPPTPDPLQGTAGVPYSLGSPWSADYESLASATAALVPLLDHLAAYDRTRRRLERERGSLDDVLLLIRLLERKIEVALHGHRHTLSLVERASIQQVMQRLDHLGLHFEVRQLANGLPAYYLCRIRRDYWSDYSLVVEDLYRSPDYPLIDPRFAKLMTLSGRQRYFLRASLYRERLWCALAEEMPEIGGGEVDRRLYDAGTVLQSAWHEDQRPVALIAQAFALPKLIEAVELLYLCLGSDLCSLRDRCDQDVIQFFHLVHTNSGIGDLLARLGSLDGAGLSAIPERARRLYRRLAKSLRDFLAVTVAWPAPGSTLPLNKLVLANFTRLETIAPSLRSDAGLATAALTLEAEAERTITEILAISQPAPTAHSTDQRGSQRGD